LATLIGARLDPRIANAYLDLSDEDVRDLIQVARPKRPRHIAPHTGGDE